MSLPKLHPHDEALLAWAKSVRARLMTRLWLGLPMVLIQDSRLPNKAKPVWLNNISTNSG